MRIRQTGAALVLGMLAVARAASAQVTPAAGYTPPDDTQSIKVGALIFYDFTYTKSPKVVDAAGNLISANAFNVTRTYINVTGNVSHRLAFRITPDITRESGPGSSLNGSLTFRLKYGYAQIGLDDYTGQWKQTWVRLGIQQHPFIDAQEGVYRYRFQGTVFVERDGGIPSSDAGVTFHTNFPNNFGDFHAGFYNGEGYGKAEVNDQKSFQMRATLRPMPGGSSRPRDCVSRASSAAITSSGTPSAPSGSAASGTSIPTSMAASISSAARIRRCRRPPKSTRAAGRSSSTPFFKEKGNGFEALVRYDSYHAEPRGDARRQHLDAQPDDRRRRLLVPAPGRLRDGGASVRLRAGEVRPLRTFGRTATQQRYTVHGLISF